MESSEDVSNVRSQDMTFGTGACLEAEVGCKVEADQEATDGSELLLYGVSVR